MGWKEGENVPGFLGGRRNRLIVEERSKKRGPFSPWGVSFRAGAVSFYKERGEVSSMCNSRGKY